MKNINNNNQSKLFGMGVLTAITSSLCCITPVLAFFSGFSGLVSAFTWTEPMRPYLLGLMVIVLGFSWYQKLKPRKINKVSCDCEDDEKPSFLQSKRLLGLMTIFAISMSLFPYYSQMFYPNVISRDTSSFAQNQLESYEFDIQGMTCSGCEKNIEQATNNLDGVSKVKASHTNQNVIVEFDGLKTTPQKIQKAIETTGYQVLRYKGVQ